SLRYYLASYRILTLSLVRVLPFSFRDAPTLQMFPPSLHDALPIYTAHTLIDFFVCRNHILISFILQKFGRHLHYLVRRYSRLLRSEEHTFELQSREKLVCRLLLEKKKLTSEHHQRSIA